MSAVFKQPSHIKYHHNSDDFYQGSEAWLAARCGLLTASEMKLIITPSLKVAANEKTRTHLYELLAQRVNKYVEPHYINDDMMRGHDDEVIAKELYAKYKKVRVDEMGFITNDKWGFTLGFSPDGLIGDDGFIECKSRRQKFQFETIIECVKGQKIPLDYLMQQQTGHLVSERAWCDFLSFSGGIGMPVIRVYPDEKVMDAIVQASGEFERQLSQKWHEYTEALNSGVMFIPTERRNILEMQL
ncbi:MAG: YqaJ viral recombinase family protein [Pseudomonadota bacterium]|nr:YqaJ viral recombinase family protein [Pseudomonadota bacterium]